MLVWLTTSAAVVTTCGAAFLSTLLAGTWTVPAARWTGDDGFHPVASDSYDVVWRAETATMSWFDPSLTDDPVDRRSVLASMSC